MPYKILIAEDEQEEYELVLYLLNKLKLVLILCRVPIINKSLFLAFTTQEDPIYPSDRSIMLLFPLT